MKKETEKAIMFQFAWFDEWIHRRISWSNTFYGMTYHYECSELTLRESTQRRTVWLHAANQTILLASVLGSDDSGLTRFVNQTCCLCLADATRDKVLSDDGTETLEWAPFFFSNTNEPHYYAKEDIVMRECNDEIFRNSQTHANPISALHPLG